MKPRYPQEQLFITGDVSQQTVPIDVESVGGSVDLALRNISLENVLSAANRWHQVEGFGKSRDIDVQAKQTEIFQQARVDFARAYGVPIEESPDKELVIDAGKEFMKFWGIFGIRSKRQARNNYRNRLIHNTQLLQEDADEDYSSIAVAAHVEVRSTGDIQEALPRELQFLDTRERLIAIVNDPRAGFIPTTNFEKNAVMTYLDYLDNADYPLEEISHFDEIFLRARRFDNPDGRDRGPVSIVYAWGDILENAILQLDRLRILEARVAECPNPKVSLYDELERDDIARFGLAPLARYADLSELITSEEMPSFEGIQDPLLTRTVRHKKSGPGKHKTIGDGYTLDRDGMASPEYISRINTVAAKLTIKDARTLVPQAIADQEKRRDFFEKRLVGANRLRRSGMLGKVASTAESVLGELEITDVS